ncbi:hypothetical protein QRO08_11790 [Paracidovorax citrulli]|uniref:Uncharacterized protein n=2 Tax=Paracidovorax citrulli TaxID=80869 RepID=A1TQS6_PARC0|nr:hypothetical protein [Paracidovorax citrulli]ABM33314.1 hypothetical protein Aave_2746 [Paracidovorax citrulli AAC00-1]ATG92765.1 hypothetical protein CQB05_00775 [Paracidovorax citrulli]MVT28897.1 hypothetical protein [Paracidovorax citrulli]MVT36580.1 hypothetical protein [Paracidovorax citrulli]PVY62893.1 hypothetical protein C8E08_0156 [Paracidovorax citrulli]
MGRIVLAYHGCDITTRDEFVRGQIKPRISTNQYDWLGDGLYFFESDWDRALKLAHASQHHPHRLLTKKPIATPAVVGAVLDVDRWFDLTTQAGIRDFTRAAQALVDGSAEKGATPPENKAAFIGDTDLLHRGFDRAACEMVHTFRAVAHHNALIAQDTQAIVASAPYQASRGAFEQGGLVSHRSSICTDTHIQIAVRDLACIKGWFLVPGDELLNDEDLVEAKRRLGEAKRQRTAAKPRQAAK